jgi:hypothetical protein
MKRVSAAIESAKNIGESDPIPLIRSMECIKDAFISAVKEAKPPIVNVTVPIQKKREIMSVDYDADNRIVRTVKQEVD